MGKHKAIFPLDVSTNFYVIARFSSTVSEMNLHFYESNQYRGYIGSTGNGASGSMSVLVF